MRLSVSKVTSAIALAFVMATSHGASSTASFQVTANVASSCTASASDLGFGTYDPLSVTPNSATSTVTVQCTLLSAYTVGLDAGIGAGATVATRRMSKGADTLDYSLYKDATHLVVWGDSGGDTVAGVGTGLAAPLTVYGQIPASQNVNTGAYADTVTVTVNY